MSITFFEEQADGRSSSDTREETNYQRVFVVKVDDADDDAAAIYNYYYTPKYGERHPSDQSATLKSRSVTADDIDNRTFILTCNYSRSTTDQGNHNDNSYDNNDNAIDMPPEINFSSTQREILAHFAYSQLDLPDSPSIPIANSANKVPVFPPTVTKSNLVISITRNERERDFNPAKIQQYEGTVNKQAITIAGLTIPAITGLMSRISATKMYDRDGEIYYKVSYSIEIDKTTHIFRLANVGYEFIDGRKIYSTDINPDAAEKYAVTEPVFLTADGTGVSAEPTTVDLLLIPPANWSALRLPSR